MESCEALKLAQPDLESLVMEHHLKDRRELPPLQFLSVDACAEDVQDAQALLDLFCSIDLSSP